MDSIEKLLLAADQQLDQGNLQAAGALYANICKLDDRCAEAFLMLGSIKAEQGEVAAAIHHVEKAIALDKTYAEAYLTLGVLYHHAGWIDKAYDALIHALEIEPDYLEAWQALGTLGGIQDGDFSSTAAGLNQRVQIAQFLWRRGQIDASVDLYRAILKEAPDHILANLDLGGVYGQQRLFVDARSRFDHVLHLEPNNVEALMNLGRLGMLTGEIEKARALFKAVIDVIDGEGCGRENPDARLEKLRYMANCSFIFLSNYVAGIEAEQIFREHVAWGDRYGGRRNDFQFTNARQVGRKLRIAYVSPNFCRHSVAFFMEQILENHDKDVFDIICYSDVIVPNQITEQFEELSTTWRQVFGVADQVLLEQIRNDRVDILVDLAGHSDNNRLPVFAQRAAPIQVTYLGYPNTTGLAAMDYRITDSVADPESNDEIYRERLYRLPGCFLCYSPYSDCPDVVSPPCVENGHITFGSMNTIAKLNNDVIAAWASILCRVPTSKLILKNLGLSDEQVRKRILDSFASYDIAPDRLELVAWTPDYRGHFGLYGRIDVALDTFPYNGTTTTCEALWMGVPVIVMAQRHHAGRVGASIMRAIGNRDAIAETVEEYIENAVLLTSDRTRLVEMRQSMRATISSSKLCDGNRFTRGLESAYKAMWEEYCSE